MDHHHRSGGLKQANKSHKQSSKRAVDRAQRGRVPSSTAVGAMSKNSRSAKLKSEGKSRRALTAANKRNAAAKSALAAARLGLSSTGGHVAGGLPRVLAIGAVHADAEADVAQLIAALHKQADAVCATADSTAAPGIVMHGDCCAPTLHFKSLRTKLTLVRIPRGESGDVLGAVAATRAADLLVLCTPGRALLAGGDGDDLVDAQGEELIAALKSAGMPTVVPVASGINMRAPGKKLAAARNLLSRLFDTEFGEAAARVHAADDVPTLLRTLSTMRGRDQPWRAARPYTLAQKWSWTGTHDIATPKPTANTTAPHAVACAALAGNGLAETDAVEAVLEAGDVPNQLAVGELRISGWVRGGALDCGASVLVPGVGTFPLARIERAAMPFARADGSEATGVLAAGLTDGGAGDDTLAPVPDLGASEQNWPSLAEEVAAEVAAGEAAAAAQTYMSAWAVDDEDLANLPAEYSAKKIGLEATAEDEDDLAGLGGTSVAPSMLGGSSAAQSRGIVSSAVAVEEEQLEFPDEVDVPDDVPARVRFARYRGMPSFKHSAWDPKEALPRSYARVFSVPNFEESCKRVQKDSAAATAAAKAGALDALGNGASSTPGGSAGTGSAVGNAAQHTLEERAGAGWLAPGQYVTLVLRDVPALALLGLARTRLPAVAVALLPLETKTSVLHCTLQRMMSEMELSPAQAGGAVDSDGDGDDNDSLMGYDAEAEAVIGGSAAAVRALPVPSKTPLEFVCGWRRWSVRPIFSEQVLGCDRAKFERFLHAGRWTVATVFGPITWPPAPVLAIRRDASTGAGILVGSGSMTDAKPDRLVLKKVILTGTPVKIKRRSAVVRHMFHRPADVRWFKPIALWTKYGHAGTIKESVGTHGAFKALFSGIVAPHDTVAMSLWKRVYPRWGEGYRHVLGDTALDSSTGKLIPGVRAAGEQSGPAPANALDAYLAAVQEGDEDGMSE